MKIKRKISKKQGNLRKTKRNIKKQKKQQKEIKTAARKQKKQKMKGSDWAGPGTPPQDRVGPSRSEPFILCFFCFLNVFYVFI